jgi:hypothetical protein
LTTTSFSANVECRLAVAPHLGVEQEPLLAREAALEQGGDAVDHGIQRDVGHEAEPPLVDADQRHVELGQAARRVEHGAVAAEDDRQFGALADRLVAGHRIAVGADRRPRCLPRAAPRHRACSRKPASASRDSATSRLWYLPIRAMRALKCGSVHAPD